MAIKQRVLAKLKGIGTELHIVAESGNLVLLKAVIQKLTDVRELCHDVLLRESSMVYDEVFAGIITVVRTLLTDESKDSPVEVLLMCKDILQDIAANLDKERCFKKEIVFLPYKASMWDSMESVWQAACNDREHTITYVVPLPYADRNPDGSVRKWHCEAAEFPKYVPVVDYRHIDLEEMHPSIIVIHNPYDDYNSMTSVDEKYYTNNLKRWTDLLVYIPYYIISGKMEPTQGSIPPLLNVDYIVVQSQSVIKYFSSSIPREKFLPLGSPKLDRVLSICRNPPNPPVMWKRKMQGKKVYFYNTSINSLFADTRQFLEELQYVFGCFKEKSDACLIWRPHPLLESAFMSRCPEFFHEFERIRDSYLAEDFGIYDKTPDIEKTISFCDAYIGDERTSVDILFGVAGKPVFYLNARIHQRPGKEAWLGNVNRVWNFFAKDWLLAQGNQLWHAPKHDLHFHHACDLSDYGGGRYYGALLELDNKLYVCPNNAQDILVVENEEIVKRISLDRKLDQPGAFSSFAYDFADDEDYFFLLPVMYPAVVRYDFRHDKLDYISCPKDVFVCDVDGEKWRGGAFFWREWMILGSAVDSRGFAVNRHTLETRAVTICHENFSGSMFALQREWGEDEYFFFPYKGRKATRWNVNTGEVQEYDFPADFQCRNPASNDICDIRPFSSGIFQDENTILLAPFRGNMFVKLHIDTGVMEEWKTPFKVTPEEKNGHYFAGNLGYFIVEPDRETATWRPKSYHFYYAPERKRYHFDSKTEKFTPLEQDVVIDVAEIRRHAPGFCQLSEYNVYGCREDVFNSLADFVDDRISGKQFDRAKQLEAYGKIAVNCDGTAGEKIYKYIRDCGKEGAR